MQQAQRARCFIIVFCFLVLVIILSIAVFIVCACVIASVFLASSGFLIVSFVVSVLAQRHPHAMGQGAQQAPAMVPLSLPPNRCQ